MPARPTQRPPDLLDHLGRLTETRAVRIGLAVLIIVSLLPYRDLEDRLRPLFLVAFGAELAVRSTLLVKGRTKRTRGEYLFLLVDLLAFVSFLPLQEWFGPRRSVALLEALRVSRLLVLLRFVRELARDVYSILTRREMVQQFGLVTVAVIAFAFVAAVLLWQLDIPHDYDGRQGAGDTFWDRMWWSFRQIESPDNLVDNLYVHPLVAVISLGLTIAGVFVISFIIGLGANIVGQVVRTERWRRVGYRGHSLIIGAVGQSGVLVGEFVRIYDKNRLLRRIRPVDLWEWLFHGAPAPRRHALPRMALLGPKPEAPAYLYDPSMRWVVYRTGDGADPEALERVAAPWAKRVILVAHRDAGVDADAVTVASLAAFRAMNPTAQAFVEVLDSENEPIFESVGGPGTFALDVPRFLGLFLCHHLVAPGVEALYRDLLTAAGCEFYTHVYVDPRENEQLAQLSSEHAELSFADMARAAYLDHGVLLVGVFLGDSVARLPGGLVPVDRLVQWINPEVLGDDEDLAAFDLRPGRIPVAKLRGVIGVATTYLPLRRYGRELLHGRGLRPEHALAADRQTEVGALAARARAEERPVRRVLVVGYSPAVGWLLRALARFVPDVEVVLALGARADAATSLGDRLATLRMGLEEGEPPGTAGRVVELERGGRVTVHTHEGADLASFAVECLKDRAPVDAAVFLSDPESVDPDARTLMRVLRFARALERDEVRRSEGLHVLAEFEAVARGQRLEAHLTASRCGFDDAEQLRLTLVSTDQMRNYFMVHSAFVPGVMRLYDKLLGARGQEIVRLSLAEAGVAAKGTVTMPELVQVLRPRGAIPLAVEIEDGSVRLNPGPDERFDARELRGLYVIGDSDRLPSVFRGGFAPEDVRDVDGTPT